ncbi:hypothetical protein [Lachnoclostridium sp.]|uniref:hypothetical protein n=1 Tax=Lachnoclostridium sp. TaxID=2028282 RepID=UPI00289AFAB6|nr:hypothetical protein [Lachnoclostridium sp.]
MNLKEINAWIVKKCQCHTSRDGYKDNTCNGKNSVNYREQVSEIEEDNKNCPDFDSMQD